MDSEEEKYEREMEMEQRRMSIGQQGEVAADVQLSMLRNSEENINSIKDQLDLGKEIEKLQQLLKGNIFGYREDGSKGWIEPKNNKLRILSDDGVHLIINTISFYLMQNTLLSNYDEDTINAKMEDFSTSLADDIFMAYETYFLYPTFEDCKEVLQKRIDKKIELRKFALELIGSVADNEIIKKEVIKELEERIEHEIETIRAQLIKDKLKHFDMLTRKIQDSVHSTYLRALNGAERRTARANIHVSESAGYNQSSGKNKQQSSYNPVSWMRRG